MGLGGGTISNCLGTLQTLVATRTDVGYAGYDFPRLYAPPPPPGGPTRSHGSGNQIIAGLPPHGPRGLLVPMSQSGCLSQC